MSDISQWDPIDANNSDPPPDGFPEGQSAGSLNDASRAVMGAVRRQWEQSSWFDYGDAVTFVSSSQLNLVGTDLANRYHVDRRVRVTGTATGTVYGVITNTAGDYVITVSLDSGAFSADPDLVIAVGAPADNSAISYAALSNIPAAMVSPYPPRYLAGCELSNAADADHDITIAIGSARDQSNAGNMDLASALTKQIDPITGWAEGDNASGFPNALSLAADTWYYVFLIAKPDGTTDGGFDVSPVAVNLLADAGPSGYTLYRRIGWVRTDATSNILAFRQIGDRFYWIDPGANGLDLSNASVVASESTHALTYCPPSVRVQMNVTLAAATFVNAWLYETDRTTGTVGQLGSILPSIGVQAEAPLSVISAQVELFVDASTEFHSRGSGGTWPMDVQTMGWTDTRGR